MKKLTLLAVATGMSSVVQASSFDAKTMAMGDAGVATADYMSGMTLNPAALVDYEERRAFNVHVDLGLVASDQDELLDNADDLADTLDMLDGSVIDASVADDLISQLEAIDGNTLWGEGGGGAYLTVPMGSYSIGLFAQTNIGLAGTALVDDEDIDLINDAVTNGTPFDEDDLDSSLLAVGAMVTEGGIKIAKHFGNASFGITPKYQRVDTIEYVATIENFDSDDVDADEYTTEANNFNLDLGYQQEFGNWRVGAVLENLIEEDYSTISGRTVSIEPQLTLGGGFRNGWFTAALDIEANAVENLGTGVDSQFARVGFEFDAWHWAQLRFGFQTDLEDTFEDTISAGIGLSPFGVINLDIAGIYGENDTYGAVMQFGIDI